ncbi:hypothetical protein [Methylobacterium nigriterrae]|uniref:hypothetical protein n=1 Tax=Methylobacterium nigriterrae TaxID=3127512 RepID=UPI003013FA54
MTPSYIAGAFHRHTPLRSSDLVDLVGREASAFRIYKQTKAVPAGEIVWLTPGRFEFAAWASDLDRGQGAERALLFLVRNEAGEAVDIAAWQPATGRTATWLGQAWALGQDTIYLARMHEDDVLPIRRDVLAWLEAGQRGLVLLDHRRAALRLADAGPLEAEDWQHRHELLKALTRPTPRILIGNTRNEGRAA